MQMTAMLEFMNKAGHAYGRLCRPLLEATGLPQTSLDILMFLANHPQKYTAGDICEMKHLKANVVSLHVDRLVREGYLERQPVEGDRRKIRLVCTRLAQPVIDRGRAVQKAYVEATMAGLSPSELEIFRHCLRTIAQNVDQLLEKQEDSEHV